MRIRLNPDMPANPLVLVADDEPAMNDLVAGYLRAMAKPKFDVIQAHDGGEAWKLARMHLPDLVVLDVMMPEMSGWEVCKKIREDVAFAHTGVVMLTGIGQTLNAITSPLYEADAYIDKPFDPSELEEKVRHTLKMRAEAREAVDRPSMSTFSDDPAPKAPTKKAPAKKAATKQAPAKKAPAKKAPAKKAPAKKAPAKKAPAKKAPAIKSPVIKAPAKKAPAKKAPAKKAPAKKAPAIKAPAKKAPAIKAPVKKAPAIKAPVKKASVKKAPVKKAPAKKTRR
jgi:CheY-like chemotaxis protein